MFIEMFQEVLDIVYEFLHKYSIYLMIFGIIECFLGHRLHRIQIAIICSGVGGALGYIVSFVSGIDGMSTALIGGVLGLVFALTFYYISLFLTVALASGGCYIFSKLLLEPGIDIIDAIMSGVVYGVIAGILVALLNKYAVIVLTSFFGATAIILSTSINKLNDGIPLETTKLVLYISLISLVGIAVQSLIESLLKGKLKELIFPSEDFDETPLSAKQEKKERSKEHKVKSNKNQSSQLSARQLKAMELQRNSDYED